MLVCNKVCCKCNEQPGGFDCSSTSTVEDLAVEQNHIVSIIMRESERKGKAYHEI